jgi:hypothetical protein
MICLTQILCFQNKTFIYFSDLYLCSGQNINTARAIAESNIKFKLVAVSMFNFSCRVSDILECCLFLWEVMIFYDDDAQ